MPATTTVAAMAVLLFAGCSTRLVDRIGESTAMRSAILELIPMGTPIADAGRRLGREGFQCQPPSLARFGEQGPLRYAYCDGRSCGLPVYRRWQLALVDSDGRLSDVLVANGLVGP